MELPPADDGEQRQYVVWHGRGIGAGRHGSRLACAVPAILAGNSVIIKHSARTPLCADHFVDAFAAAGAPEGLITSLHCDHDVVNAVIRNPLTAFVSFTGSVPGGHAVYVLARTLVCG